MKSFVKRMAVALAVIVLASPDTARSQAEDKQPEKKRAMKAEQGGQGMMPGA
jgi:hypothetical protein